MAPDPVAGTDVEPDAGAVAAAQDGAGEAPAAPGKERVAAEKKNGRRCPNERRSTLTWLTVLSRPAVSLPTTGHSKPDARRSLSSAISKTVFAWIALR